MLMIGPPGTGKSMLAQRFPGLLPDMDDDEALSAAAVMSLTTRGFDAQRWKVRPFRAPHHTASAVAMVGGGVRRQILCDPFTLVEIGAHYVRPITLDSHPNDSPDTGVSIQ